MSRMIGIIPLIALLVYVPCAKGFEASWTDQFGETTYMITGPDEVFVSDTVEIVLSAVDSLYPNAMVAAPWSFVEDSVEVDGGFGIFLTDTLWQSVYTFVYESTGEHTYTFTGQDLGHGSGGHNWEWFAIGSTTVISPPTAVASGSWGDVKLLFR